MATKALTKKSAKHKLLWAGAKELMGAPKDQQAARERQTVELVAQVLNVTPYGVNVLGGQPYLNNLGRKDKLYQYEKTATFEYNWVQRALDDTQKAICEARIVLVEAFDEKFNPIVRALTPWIVGECSDATMGAQRTQAFHGYQNHMAQTRAENRAFQYLYGLKLHHEMLENLASLRAVKTVTVEQERQIASATTVSAEEIQTDAKRISQTGGDVKAAKVAEILKIISSVDVKTGRTRLEQLKGKIMDSKLYTQAEKSSMVEFIDVKLGV